jgi:pyruvate formate lyase activating enzyme
MIEALLYQTEEKRKVRCCLCGHRCLLGAGQSGICRVRKNIGGALYSLNSDRVSAVHLDPIEKKPLYHFLPGSVSFSIAAMGCNFSCRFCQNHDLSQVRGEAHIFGKKVSPEELVQKALQAQALSISYTYTEPTVFFELMMETARIAQKAGLKNVMVTNGYMSAEALTMIAPYLDAANIDLKFFSEEFYHTQCGAKLKPVLDTIREMKHMEIWIEVTTLLIPGLNNAPEHLRPLVRFLLEIDPEIPWHVSRFFPQYQLNDLPITPSENILQSLALASEMGLRFVYGGNLNDDRSSDTFCPECRHRLIQRHGYQVQITGLINGVCGNCRRPVPGVWQSQRRSEAPDSNHHD